MIRTKVIMCLVAILTFCACQQSTKNEPTIRKELNDITDNRKDSSDVDKSEVILVTKIDRERAKRFDVSTSVIGAKIREILKNNESELSIEEFLNQRLTFKNNRGKIVDIPLSSVIDTAYFE